MLRFFRSFGVCDANQFCFVLFAICGFCTVGDPVQYVSPQRKTPARDRPVLRNVEVSAHIVERAAILRFLRFFGVGDANRLCFVLFAIYGFFHGRRSSAVCRFPI